MEQFYASAQRGPTLTFEFNRRDSDYKEEGHFVVFPAGVALHCETSLPKNRGMVMPYTQLIRSDIPSLARSVDLFSKLELAGRKEGVLEVLRKMDRTLSDIAVLTVDGQPQLYAKAESVRLPMMLAGDGTNRLLYILLTILDTPDSVILIDEIERGFHYSMYPVLWDAVRHAAVSNNCQVIATTHSYECVSGAIESIQKVAKGDSEDLCLFRLERNTKGRTAYRYSGDLLKYAMEANVEVR